MERLQSGSVIRVPNSPPVWLVVLTFALTNGVANFSVTDMNGSICSRRLYMNMTHEDIVSSVDESFGNTPVTSGQKIAFTTIALRIYDYKIHHV
jgi:hypothetical protein